MPSEIPRLVDELVTQMKSGSAPACRTALIPADIAPLDGTRVLILRPPNGNYALSLGRVFEHMTPALRLDRILEPAETEHWLARSAHAVENDLMAE